MSRYFKNKSIKYLTIRNLFVYLPIFIKQRGRSHIKIKIKMKNLAMLLVLVLCSLVVGTMGYGC